MTAEIAIINRHAIALAADSAVTVGREKVWKTANKLFSLGPHHDIAIMVYGAGDFLGLGWETIIKEFRRRSIKRTFLTVDACAVEFKAFLMDDQIFTRNDQQMYAVLFPIFDIISNIDDDIADEKICREVADQRAFLGSNRSDIKFNVDEFKKDIEKEVVGFCEEKFKRKLSKRASSEIIGLAIDFFCSKIPSQYHSGVVVAGFGANEYYPAMSHNIVDGRWKSSLRCWDGEHCKDLNTKDHHDEFPIVPFAQDDMSYQFMTGISNDYLNFLGGSLEQAMQTAFSEFAKEFVAEPKMEEAETRSKETARAFARAVMDELFNKVRKEQYEPINRAVGALPKEEMAMVAEALVDLTSLKRKVDSQLESVGGPVDVAVISKGDGFIWIKRKFYFDPLKNSEFFARKKIRDGDVHEE